MYIVDVETGQAVQNFTQPNYRDIVQAWSPDGRLLAFTRQSTISNTYQIQMRVVDVESGRRIPHLTKSDGVYFNSIWSPDGQWLVFQKLRGNTTAIYIADPQSGETRLLSDAAFTVPIWSPDSRWIAYTHLEAGVGGAREVLSIIDPVNGESRLMTHHNGSDSHATWALDSHHLIILSDRDGSVKLYLLNIETEAATLLSPDTYGLTETPVWSPDGEWLALTSVENLQSQIYLLDMEDQAMVHITDSGWASSPAWQP
jgi:tricorn protease-like protein